MLYDDIAAISTPPGEGGIAIVRLSGTEVIPKVNSIFKPYKKDVDLHKKQSFTLTLGWILDEAGNMVDEVLVSVMKNPHSYTGEDVVEINCHGGTIPARKCLEEVLKTGVRIAEPGEFTKRAFLNGRLDVSQAEAVIEVIRSKTDKGLMLALNQLSGKNSIIFSNLEDELIRVNAMVEASLDFPDDVGDLDITEAINILNNILINIDKLLLAGERAEIYREGVNIAICGKPNVGKSSLLNALLKKDKAIVTNIPGTTRDVIEDFINIKGIPIKLRDTAGIRFTNDVVEKIGVEKSKQVIKEAELVIFILDVETGITKEDVEIFNSIDNKNIIILVNKEDIEEKRITKDELIKFFGNSKVIRGSVKEDIGLEELEKTIEDLVISGEAKNDDLNVMINIRQKNALLKAKKYLEDTLKVIGEAPLDCIGVDIWGALEAIGEITGKSLKEEVIDRIFADFCIGK